MPRFGIIGTGSWGTAIAILLNANAHAVTLWNRDVSVLETINKTHENKKYLPGVRISEKIELEPDLNKAVTNKDCIVVAVPSHAVRQVFEQINHLSEKTVIVSLVKGIENETLLRVSQILKEIFPRHEVAVLAGPSHAEEVSRGIPTAVVCASENLSTAKWVQQQFMSPQFRVYTHSDIIGVELGGALKNIIALAAGITEGAGGGDSTKAALMTRGLAEITRLGTRLGANSMTFAGLSGMGDLIVTCMSKYSRNRYVGEQIGKGKTLEQVLSEMVMVAEGVKTTISAHQLAQKNNVEVPIIHEVYQILFQNKDPKQAVYDLMTRAAKIEDWG